ncbi:FAD-binding protein [Microbulbifer sp. YPW1]|uniref:FAD-binding protein n=1 Tax=Microbulbifer sp. YPW1 TaxID=2745199 RepID=UPI0015981795|nr:FAD-binding protein [Microbulbifer sp. YPW1]QKX17944.1 FAD-binding protein [Microbulbifer sp. YPW1]
MAEVIHPGNDQDYSEGLAAQVRECYVANTELETGASSRPHLVVGGNGSRVALGLPGDATLAIGMHRGVIDYQPEELTLRARAGTPLSELEALLAHNNQSFAAEIPQPSPQSTLGGAIASGWDGPSRAFGMALRDSLLGCRLINGRGEIVNFGGQVMKNVAGYDLARLQVGALGTLGAILDVTLRLQPRAEHTASISFAVAPGDLAQWWQRTRSLRPLLTGTCYQDGRLYLRISGRTIAVQELLTQLGGDATDFDWAALTNFQLPFFCSERLACVHLPRYAHLPVNAGQALVEWEGARVWVRDGDHHALARVAADRGGFVQIMRGPLVPAQADAPEWHCALRDALDPKGLFNPVLFRARFCSSDEAPERVANGAGH